MSKDIADLLAAEAEEAERHADEEDHGPTYRRKHPPRDPAQVYSLRIPVAQLEDLRQLAADRSVTPSALMREWVLERVTAEKAGQPDPVRLWERLREALEILEGAQSLLRQRNQDRHRTESAATPAVSPVTLDPEDQERREIRILITDQVVERMEEEIAEWRQERASGSGGRHADRAAI
ncbi:MAG: hypothetical protein ACRDNZ_13670 [Streptosporangiaceae bacterium]